MTTIVRNDPSKEFEKLLKQGAAAWNQWREENPYVEPFFIGADLRGIDLSGVDLSGIDCSHADLSHTRLVKADLERADLSLANLKSSELREADLGGANLSAALLDRADLTKASLTLEMIHNEYITSEELYVAGYFGTNLRDAEFGEADVSEAEMGWTLLVNNDLSRVKGLETVRHHGPSYVGIDTIYLSQGKIPPAFLRGAGVPDDFIAHVASVKDGGVPYYSCFISYSNKDAAFVRRLHADLQKNGVRCWFAPENLRIGERIRRGIDESINKQDKLLLVLSKHSVASSWVEKEVETAMDREQKESRTMLFPIRLDDSVMKIELGWPADIRKTRHIGDFKKWRDLTAYQSALRRLLRDLRKED